MRGKIILLFILALIALAFIGFLGQRGLRSMIVSIEEASQPNAKIAGLGEIMQSLSDAESSVRSYIITRDQQTLEPFKESAATINIKLDQLKSITENPDQTARLVRLEELITGKYETLTQLINVRNDQEGNVLRKVIQDIDKLKTEAEEEADEEGRQDPSVFERLFGEEPTEEDSAAMEPTISSSQLDKAIDRIDREESATSRQLMAQELRLTQQDNAIMNRIRAVMDEIQQAEILLSSSRTASVRETSEDTINTITIVLVITLFVFAFLLSVIFNDIRRSRINRERLREAKERAEKLARVKEEFLSNMSHEIRTPLNAVIGFTEQLEESDLSQEQSLHLTRIKNSGDHLLRLINDILDYAKMESRKMALEKTGFEPTNEINETKALLQSSAEKKGLSLESNIDPNLPDVLLGDSVRFRQIVINLVNNAIKFTKKGKITITIRHMSALKSNRHLIKLSVTDTGIGIPEDKLESIFDEFSQADNSTARKYGGSGLGLSIVHKLAGLHEGSVEVESEEGKGTTFHVTLEYMEGSYKDLPQKKSVIQADMKGIRALVVDDQEYNLELLETILRKWQMTCTTASSGEAALEKVTKEKYDIILLDVQMPGLSGLEVARRMRGESHIKPTVPIIALTAGTADEDKKQAQEAGMQFFLSKPYTRDQLKRMIIEACGLTYKEEQNSDSKPDQPHQLKLNGLLELANGDMGFVTNMLTIFRTNFTDDLHALTSAAQQSDWSKVSSVAHKMSPPCGHLGFSEVAGELKTIEKEAAHSPDPEQILHLVNDLNTKSSTLITEIDNKISELDPNRELI